MIESFVFQMSRIDLQHVQVLYYQ